MKKVLKYKKTAFIISIIIFAIAVGIPLIVKGGVFGISEEILEVFLLFFLLLGSYSLNLLYLKEVGRLRRYQVNLEDRLQDTFKYIGSVNLQMEEMRKAFANFKKYPESKKDIRTVFVYFSEKILSMINADWVILRIIDTKNEHTVREDKFVRHQNGNSVLKIENKDILSGKKRLNDCTIISSDQDNLNIKTACILPLKLENRDQEFFIRSMINQLEMLFVVFSSLSDSKQPNTRKLSFKK
ncbi:MAG: hypothetical protein PHE20_03550 [Patescibacteria group bacterium]|nr:hypothetical protein [Patescibacteria group bacterium]